jgi:hypothetical protein
MLRLTEFILWHFICNCNEKKMDRKDGLKGDMEEKFMSGELEIFPDD